MLLYLSEQATKLENGVKLAAGTLQSLEGEQLKKKCKDPDVVFNKILTALYRILESVENIRPIDDAHIYFYSSPSHEIPRSSGGAGHEPLQVRLQRIEQNIVDVEPAVSSGRNNWMKLALQISELYNTSIL